MPDSRNFVKGVATAMAVATPLTKFRLSGMCLLPLRLLRPWAFVLLVARVGISFGLLRGISSASYTAHARRGEFLGGPFVTTTQRAGTGPSSNNRALGTSGRRRCLGEVSTAPRH